MTLIELLVVISIIGILAALLLPAVQQARESGRRMQCANNLKNLALGLHQFHDACGHLPPARVLGEVEHSWTVFVLPYIDQTALHDLYDMERDFRDPVNAPVVRTPVATMLCPSAPARGLDLFTSGGFTNWRTAPSDYVPIMRADGGLVEVGLCDEVADRRGAMSSNRPTPFGSITDGLSNTLLLTEAAGRPLLWVVGGGVPGVRVRGSGWGDSRNAFSIHGVTYDGLFSPGPCAVNCTNNREIYSFHVAGANVALADGSVRFLASNINIREACRLVTIRGGEMSAGMDQ